MYFVQSMRLIIPVLRMSFLTCKFWNFDSLFFSLLYECIVCITWFFILVLLLLLFLLNHCFFCFCLCCFSSIIVLFHFYLSCSYYIWYIYCTFSLLCIQHMYCYKNCIVCSGYGGSRLQWNRNYQRMAVHRCSTYVLYVFFIRILFYSDVSLSSFIIARE